MWEEDAPAIAYMGGLTKTSRRAFELLCDAYGEVRLLRDDIRANGRTQEIATTGGTAARPEVAMHKAAFDRYKALCIEFGMTPSSLVRLGTRPDGLKKGRWVGLAS